MFIRICSIFTIFLMCIIIFPHNTVSAEPTNKIPSWIKIVVNWWLDGSITDVEFSQEIMFLINNKIIEMPENNKNFKNERDLAVSMKSENFIIHYMKIEDYGIEPYPGRIATPEPHTKDIQPEKIEMWLRHTQYFEKQVNDLKSISNYQIIFTLDLENVKKKMHFTNMIVMCYELIFDIYDQIKLQKNKQQL